ncbi:energy transducer TonB [Lysobacter arvi]|nr:TonB family protein [Lysobacter arvi]
MQNDTSRLEDRLLGAFLAVGLPLSLIIWLMKPAALTDDGKQRSSPAGAIQIEWIPADRSQPGSEQPTGQAYARPKASTQAAQMPAPDAASEGPTLVKEANVGLPMDASGSVYDPSRMQAVARDAKTLLRTAPAMDADTAVQLAGLSWTESPPKFPDTLRSVSSARVVLEIEVDETGNAAHVSIVESSGSDEIDLTVLDAARSWHFPPEQRGGVAVRATIRCDVVLQMQAVGDDDTVEPMT